MTGKLILRANRKMFMGVKESTGETVVYTRMEGFTSLSESKNSQEYTRKYVDQTFESTDVTGMSSSYDFTFDLYDPNPVLTDLAGIIDGEKLGADAEREFISVDFHRPISGQEGAYEAIKRTYTVIPNNVGDGTDALQYSGTFKVKTSIVKGTATIATPVGGNSENVQTIEFSENNA